MLRRRIRSLAGDGRGLALGAVIAAVVAGGLLVWWRTRFAVDDAYIAYRYADNWIEGRGLVFNPGERVEGYSSFSWVMLAAAGMALELDPFVFTRILGIASYVVLLVLLGGLLASGLDRARWRNLALVPFVAALVLAHGFAGFAGCGLETTFASLLLVLIGLTQHHRRPRGRWGAALVSLLPLLACLTRPEAVLAVAASVAAAAVGERSDGASWRATLETLARRYLPTAAGLVAWGIGKTAYYGTLLPNSYRAKGADRWSWEAGGAYLLAFAENSPQILPLALLAGVGLAGRWRSKERPFLLYCAIALVLHVGFVVKVGGDFMYYRFMFHVLPLLVCLGIAGLWALAGRSFAAAAVLCAATLALSLAPPELEKRFGMQSLEEMNEYVKNGRLIGERLRDGLPPGTRIATALAGAIPYFTGFYTVDMWGINDRRVAKQVRTSITYRGHLKMAQWDYVRSRGVNLFIDPAICRCSRPCVQPLKNVFVDLGDDLCLRTWYMNETPALTAHLCAHPERFVLHDIACRP